MGRLKPEEVIDRPRRLPHGKHGPEYIIPDGGVPRVGPVYDMYVDNQIALRLDYGDYVLRSLLGMAVVLAVGMVVAIVVGSAVTGNWTATILVACIGGSVAVLFGTARLMRWNDVRKVKALADSYTVEAALE